LEVQGICCPTATVDHRFSAPLQQQEMPMELIDSIFGSGQSLSPLQEVARAIVVFSYGLVVLRLTGPRTFGKWAALDIVVSIIVGSALARTMTGGAPFAERSRR
jgi:hypothetical protein